MPAIGWRSLKDVTDEKVSRQLSEADCDILLVMKHTDLS